MPLRNCRPVIPLLIFPFPDERHASMSEKTKSPTKKSLAASGDATPAPKPGPDGEVVQEDRLTEWFVDVFVPQYGKQAGIAAAVAVVVLLGWFGWRGYSEKSQQTSNRKLGQAYVFLTQEKPDSAATALVNLLNEGPGGIAEAKANLLLGKIRFGQGRFDEAAKAYQAVHVSASRHPLIASGAMHGLAASYMEKKDYAKASEILERFAKEFGNRTGSPEEKVAGKEVADPSPVVANALWKLTLCYRELKDNAKAKATAEKLTRIYPESREGADALRLLAQL